MGIGYFFLCVKPHKLEGIPESRVLGQAIVEKSCRCLSLIPTSQAPKSPFSPGVTFMCLEPPPNRRDPGVPELKYEDFK